MMFNSHEKKLEKFRAQLMSSRSILCTGNPDNPYTIASGIRKLYPTTTFIHKSNGWNLTDPTLSDKLKQQFSKHNTFINASYINAEVQPRLLKLCAESVKFCDVVNIGSTHEYDGGGLEEYQNSKRHLRESSLALNTFRFKTYHVVLGLIRNSDKEFDGEPLTIDEICSKIQWLLEEKALNIPLITFDNPKRPW